MLYRVDIYAWNSETHVVIVNALDDNHARDMALLKVSMDTGSVKLNVINLERLRCNTGQWKILTSVVVED